MEEHVLRTISLNKKYNGKAVLKDLNMSIKRGDIYGLIGKNGAGKTTLIRLITGLANLSSGSIEIFDGDNDKSITSERKRIGTLIEMPAFYGDMTAVDNMELVRLQKGIPGKACINEKLELVGLTNIEKKKVKDFSLGMKQKLGLAMALLGDPEFLILDEPTNGLDPMGIVYMRELLKKLNKENGVTILISSHLLSELNQLATRYGILNNGELVEQLTQKELDEKCKKALEIKTDDLKKTTWVLENILKTTNYKVLPNEVIKVYDYINESGKVSKALSQEGITIYQISISGDNLENYFMSIVGGNI
ncbi:MAG: ATP-binding cassette domain-containing protein [Clostridiales bacterium]|uniref:ATP-binding cassette domain-containing protein n=1 Tax=Bacillota TaxID=1239 RepID=UPI001BB023A5|nr:MULTISPECIES: ATP-binding cassette domain-containing protein [Bacillota]MDD7592582.1 ATP-binding cassette domain-containing protein [Bacilli bacterium]MDD7753563.1 ATP-binding cassette domain-containing protein [Clostridiales bacterium]MDY5832882.1 ATP-binding cassette domain-containing protein [Candidatus Onthovivens sp.]MBS3202643.1 ATP-binding cassette domain-containing protein [Turicibacter bilis]MDY4134421.1 ATP-binding cassette domain-containing protein [Terrisporobacter sp.]